MKTAMLLVAIMLLSGCGSNELRKWGELTDDSLEELNDALIDKAKKEKEKAKKKVEEL